VIRAWLLALALVLGGCAQDTPTVGHQPEAPSGTSAAPDASPTPPVSESEDINVSAVEYEFQGVPDAVSAGPHRFSLQNEGQEPHVFYLFLITGDQSIEELIDLPEKQSNKVTQAVDRAEADPGDSDQFNADLVPGRFGYICFFQTKGGPPHFALGMRGEFTVV
jgi:uncharacterized cupredoxin-like copper-binding protein